ncbi:MAG: hypothetical protein Q8P41_10295 [Pseudomonadota bacterium]|nr:hypothetical protein [Pseudomonadota bacterium]
MRWEFFTRAAFRAAARPLEAACIALPVHVAARYEGRARIADDAGTAAAIEAMGGVDGGCTGTAPRVDRARHVVTAPAGMYGGARIADVAVGIGRPSPPRSNSPEAPPEPP